MRACCVSVPLPAYSLDDLDTTLAVNVRGVFPAIQAAVKPMAEGA